MTDRATQKPISLPGHGVRRFGRFNYLGLWTLYLKEVQRFWKIALQTVGAPIITTLLFLAIFSLALGRLRPEINGVAFVNFLAPGLIMMAMVQNAFANSSSSILISKVQGNIVDILMPPLSAAELSFGIIMGGLTRGIFVGGGTYIAIALFIDMPLTHIWALLFYAVAASLLMSSIGLVGGIWSEKFDHLATVNNFFITPLSFLSGTFYSVTVLPSFAYQITQYNPFFYMIDGFRYAFTGHAEGDLQFGVLFLTALNIIFGAFAYLMLARGYRLKS